MDQICIDQTNIPERNQQVSLMKGIYQRSERVIVWLGEEDGSTKDFVELVDAIGSQPDGSHLCSVPGDAEKLDALRKKIQPFIDLSKSSNSHGALRRRAVVSLLNRAWFQRVWVFQEVVVSRTVIMLVGQVKIHFRDLGHVMYAVWAVEYQGRGRKYSISKKTVGFEIFAQMIHRRQDYFSGKGLRNILGLLSQVGGTFNATVPHDFVYAFAGLLEDSGVKITPDYALPVQNAFMSATLALIDATKNLDVFAFVQGGAYTGPGILSWSPDWSKLQPVPMPIHDAINLSSFKASGQFEYQPLPSKSPTHLVVQGKIIDHVKAIFGHSFEDFNFMDDIRNFLNIEGHVAEIEKCQGPHSVPVTRERLLKAMLVDGGSPAGRKCRGEMLTPYFVADLLDAYDKWPQLRAEDKTAENYYKLQEDLCELQQHSLHTQCKRIVYTENGKIGLAPQMACLNDVICILHGSKTPIVLRRSLTGPDWLVIGQCYLEDVMHGEAVTWQEDEADTFELI